jgi:hypothetical protein
MSDAAASNGDGKRQAGGNDLLSAFAIAWGEPWSMGTSEVPSERAHLDRTVLSAPFEAFTRAVAGVMRDLTPALGEPTSVESRLTDHQNVKDMAVLFARAYLIAAVTGLRYWGRVAQSYGTHQPAILRSFLPTATGPGASEGARRVQADAVYAYFRELGEISAQEARAFQAELESLAEDLASIARGSQQTTVNRRRWRAKP